jgi:AhpD family alkylhydroperoxidase
MQTRMKNPLLVIPESLQALLAVDKATKNDSVPLATRELIRLRASQINGCSVCVEMHSRELKKSGESDERIFTVAAWRDTPYFTPAERAALALTEAVTRLHDRADPVPDELWNEVTKHYDEAAISVLLLQIGLINVFNRVNAATRAMAGSMRA